jgi:7-carboxy-7-deazaguanine synthase
LSSILEQVASYRTQDVCVTGGEPLAQPACLPLLTSLCDEGYSVSLETSGALSIEGVDPRVRVVMDLKTPSSGEAEKNRFENIELLKPDDEIKFVIGSADDFKWAIQHVRQYQMDKRLSVLMSPVFGEVTPLELAEWILESGLRLRFQQQLHKLIWGNEPGH